MDLTTINWFELELYGLWGFSKDFSKENGAAIQKMDAGRSSNSNSDFIWKRFLSYVYEFFQIF